ncbi:neogenin isoform X2 [Aphidius gifuensis]|uniref:neogenin isoform X2 n=1 Tax=Aphidius gifuensis TaxID=684658 RepID=UPI001CDC3EC3|nr:neogenin isoform X2 [Aphidius gifuensis]
MELFINICLTLLLCILPKYVDSADGLYFKVEPQDVIVEQSGSARLDCQAKSGFGHVNIQWRTEDGQPINFIGDDNRSQLPNGSLYINNINSGYSELTGRYQCLASVENVGSIVSRTANIKLANLPSFQREPQDTMVYSGQIAYLSCSLPIQSNRVKINWLKDEHPLILDESRMAIMPSGALEIDEVKSHDVGSYRCNASGFNQFRLSNKAQLGLLTSDIDQPLSAPIFIAKPSQQVAIEGSTITLECAANGNPKPNILWLKNGVAVDLAALDSRYRKVAASSLMITDIMEEDHGSYQCRAENKEEALDAVVEVIVQVPPRFTKRPKDKIANEHQDLEFECEIYGKPEPKITWLKNGEKITLSEYWQLVNSNNLRINGLMAIDAGIFQCIGVNPAGSVQASARLTINQPKKSHSSKSTTLKSIKKKKLTPQRQLYNTTWQHPSTLIGHTSSTDHTTNLPLSMNSSDDPVDVVDKLNNPDSSYDPDSPFIDDTDSLETNEGSSVPSAPRNLSVVITKTRFITLRWQEPENGNDDSLTYYLYYKQEGSQRERVVNTAHKQLEVMVSGLQPGVTYQFRVVAHNSRGAGMSSEILRETTLSEANVPGPPIPLDGHATSSTSIKFSWQQPEVLNGRISKYVVTFVKGEDEDEGEEKTRETTSTTYELIDLVPYTEYNIWVHAVNENGPGASSGEINIRTYSSQPSQPPHNVTLEAASSSSVIIRWEPPLEGTNGIITGYKIRYRPQDRRYQSDTITTEGNQRLYVLTGLDKHVIYHVRICALNVNGTGPWTEWMAVETYENDLGESSVPSAPSNLRTKPSSLSITIWWNPPKDDGIKVRGYVVGWGKGFPDSYTKVLDGKQRTYSIEPLEPLSEYVISLRATNEAGEGPPVYANVRTTEKSVSESSSPLIPPVGLKAIVLSSKTVVLYWTDTLNQYTRYYVVRYTTVKTVKGKRESPWSMAVLNQTEESAPISSPKDLIVQNYEQEKHTIAVILQWQPPKQPNGQIIGYIISYSTDDTNRDRDWLVDGMVGNKTEYIVRSLSPSTTYFFKVQARNAKGYGPFSTTVTFKTRPNGHTLSGILVYIIVGCTVVLLTGIAVVILFICCRKNPDSPDHKKGYMKDTNLKANIKPPDLWIHHDQMELKALEKSSVNGEASTSGVANTLPRSGNSDYSQDSIPINSNSLDKRTYVPSYMAIGTATPIVNCSLSQSTIHNSCTDGSSLRPTYPRTVAQYSLSRAHITLEPTPESSPDSCSMPSNYVLQAPMSYVSSGPTYNATQYGPNSLYGSSCQTSNSTSATTGSINGIGGGCGSGTGEAGGGGVGSSGGGGGSGSGNESGGSVKRLQGHPLKSFSVPAPPPQSAPSTPAQQKHGVTIRPSISGSPYKKQLGSTSQLAKNRLTSVSSASHTPEELERLKPSYSTEELNQEMANLEGLMKDLNAITASEFEC